MDVLLIWDAFLDRALALMFGSFLLSWSAPGEEADIAKSLKTIDFCGTEGIVAFLVYSAKGKTCTAPACRKELEKLIEN